MTKRKNKEFMSRIDSCFVMMPFHKPFDIYYTKIIKPVIEEIGLFPQRGDSLFRPSPIMGDVWLMIPNAKVLIADLSEKNPKEVIGDVVDLFDLIFHPF